MKLILSLMPIILATMLIACPFAYSAQEPKLVRQCHLATNPDSGVLVEILQFDDQPNSNLLVAVIISAGNIKPHIIGTFPVSTLAPNGAGILGYTGKNFSLTISSWTGWISLNALGKTPIHISGRGPLINCN